ncbi:MAG: hypothetical protein AAB875_07485 [Patescibacteria group bacterium]
MLPSAATVCSYQYTAASSTADDAEADADAATYPEADGTATWVDADTADEAADADTAANRTVSKYSGI